MADDRAQRRIALVIGNGDYEAAPDLDNAPLDARAVAEGLGAVGFTLVGDGARVNLSGAEMREALASFGRALEETAEGDEHVVALFYYAGHAVQREGHNYLTPVGARVRSPRDVQREMIDIAAVMRELSAAAGTHIVILDACRNDPFVSVADRGLAIGGLAPIDGTPSETFLAFSTAPGRVASDGQGTHSPYTGALVRALLRDGLRLTDVFMEVRTVVDQQTGGLQQPWEHSSLTRPFYFRAPPTLDVSLEARCAGTDGDACHRLGERARAEGRLLYALAHHDRACRAGHAAACVSYTALLGEVGLSEPPAEGVARLRAACDAGAAAGCTALGRRHETGEGAPQDPQRAHDLYARACEGGDGHGCRRLGNLYTQTDATSEFERDYGQAHRLYTTACERGDLTGCSNLGWLYSEGHGVAVDYERAATLFARACAAGVLIACNNLGSLYRDGLGVESDPSRSQRLAQRACDGELWVGCTALGILYEQGVGATQDYARARDLYQRACEHDDTLGCVALGMTFESGHGVAQDHRAAATLYERACEAGDVDGCSRQALQMQRGHLGTPDHAVVAALYERSCRGAVLLDCVRLGALYQSGRGVAVDPARAISLYGQACEGGVPLGCVGLGDAYLRGRGVAADPERALGLFQRACDAGADAGCRRVASLQGTPR